MRKLNSGICFLFLSLSVHAAENNVTVLKETKQSLKKEITLLNNDLHCKKRSDCEALELGAKPCGGPMAYLTVSKKNKKHSEIKKKVAQYMDNDKTLNQLDPVLSTCDVTPLPKLECVKNSCKELISDTGQAKMTPQ